MPGQETVREGAIHYQCTRLTQIRAAQGAHWRWRRTGDPRFAIALAVRYATEGHGSVLFPGLCRCA